jgi:parvulin-like peptidyl-prolyl isomerase
VGIAGALAVLILIVSAVNEYLIRPRHVLATVDGTEIRRRDYWKVRSFELIQQANQWQQFAMFTQGQQQQQYLALARQTLEELDRVWGSTDLNQATLARMIDDQVFLHSLDDLGLPITDQDVRDFIDRQFEPPDAPIYTPTPSPTLIPTRAAWATQTAIALEELATPAAAHDHASPAAAAADHAAGAASPGASAPLTDAAVGSPEPAASPVASPVRSPTPNQEQARQTAAAGFEAFKDATFGRAHLSEADYERWIVRPAIARQKVRAALEAEVGQTAEQVHAAHILVGTRDLAESIFEQLQQPGADFEQIAKDQSIDEATAPTGGDLGWFARGIMVKAFDDVAFSLQPGEISPPFQTEFGWHIVKVYAREADRPLTDQQIERLKANRVEAWLEERRAATRIRSELRPTPTPMMREFEPPPDAPPAPMPTPVPATPQASPPAVPFDSASPIVVTPSP